MEFDVDEKLLSLKESVSSQSSEFSIIASAIKDLEKETDVDIIKQELKKLEVTYLETMGKIASDVDEIRNDFDGFKKSLSYPQIETHLHGESYQRQITELKNEIGTFNDKLNNIREKSAFRSGLWKAIYIFWMIATTATSITLSVLRYLKL
jgi:hypothetical protein